MPSHILTWGIIGAIVLVIFSWLVIANTRWVAPQSVACTMEALICPDGSAVGRSGPNCEFAACPVGGNATSTTGKGSVSGFALLSPICPVERIPPDPSCTPKGYEGMIEARDARGNLAMQTKSDARGAFTFALAPGAYTFSAVTAGVYPRCTDTSSTVISGKNVAVTIECDTGIRTPTQNPSAGTGSVKLNQTYTTGSVSITPLSIVEDSRCPSDVQCIQAGTVRVSVRILSGVGGSTMTIELGKSVTTEAENITLLEVVPAPRSSSPIPPGSYIFTFQVRPR